MILKVFSNLDDYGIRIRDVLELFYLMKCNKASDSNSLCSSECKSSNIATENGFVLIYF